MGKILFFAITIFYCLCFNVNAQIDSSKIAPQPDIFSIGLGAGLDYGGFGLNAIYYPQTNIGIFAGFGYPIAGFGYNVGAKIRFSSKQSFRKFTFHLTSMYGYNAAIMVINATQYNKLFYGPSFGLGFDYKAWPEKRGYWSFALLIPIRNSEVFEYIDDLKNNHGAEFKTGLIPIAFSFGYRFIIK